MISKETENVQSSEEIENAFRAITAGDRPYVTKEELYAVRHLLIYFIFSYFSNFHYVSLEPYKGNGGLLRVSDEAFRGHQDPTAHPWRPGLY